jgi:hypothetical protein
VFARATASAKYSTTNCALIHERGEHRLGAADIPWGRPDVALIEVFDASFDGPTRNWPHAASHSPP